VSDVHLSPSLVPFEMLKVLSGYQQAGAVERWARQQGIRLFYGRNGPWTTIEIINAVAGILPGARESHYYNGDLL
jgi:hypothetical protein